MLNFTNNKFVKIFLLKTVVLSNLVYDIFCICSVKNKTEIIDNTEIRDNEDIKYKKGYCDGICGKENIDQSNITTDTSIDYDSDITSDDDKDIKRDDDNEKKPFTYENIIDDNKNKLIKEINEKYEELEKNKCLIISLLNKKDFDKPSDLGSKDIEELSKILNDLTNLSEALIVAINKDKIVQQEKYSKLNDIYNRFKDTFNFNFEVTINFNEYNLDNYKDLIKKINNFENKFKDSISNIKENYKNRINELKNKYKTKINTIYIDINIDDLDLEKQCQGLKDIKEKIEFREKLFQYFIDISITKEDIEAIYKNVDNIVNDRYDFINLLNGYDPFEIYITDNLTYDFDTIYQNVVNDTDEIKFRVIKFRPQDTNKNKGVDVGGLKRQKFEEFKNHILQNIKFYKYSKRCNVDNENIDYVQDDKESNLFYKQCGYEIDSLYEKDVNNKIEINYNFFTKFNTYTEGYENYYKCLAFLCGTSVRYTTYCPLYINLSPVIYKIMLDFDFNCDLDQSAVVCDELKKIITYDDLKYGYKEVYKMLPGNETNLTIFDDEYLENYIIDGYDSLIENLSDQIKLIKLYYDGLKKYLGDYFFVKFKNHVNYNLKKYSHLVLKIFLEGKNVNKPEDVIKIIDVDTRYRYDSNDEEIINVKNARFIYECLIETLNSFNEKQIKDFLIWVYGSPALPQSIYMTFVPTLDDEDNVALFAAHSCFSSFNVAVDTIKSKINKDDVVNEDFSDDEKNIIRDYFKQELLGDIEHHIFSTS